MNLAQFNVASRSSAVAAVRPCLDIARWYETVVDERPFADTAALCASARRAAVPFSRAEIDGALSHHPRIGEKAGGSGAEARLSAGEQAGLGESTAELEAALTAGNSEYERRFGRVFLIRAAGRTRSEILAELKRRMAHTEDEELIVIADQLREIALLRLQGIINP